ncbi:MAG: hypothetical protein E6J28_00020 [Chloroflexi bacterium]|nr:MAG: hypothetical protein E6J28_00020 [Chloroflexota bacterium]
MPGIVNAIWEALQMAFFMFWEVLWPLVLGFLISAVVQSLVSRQAVARVLGRDDLRGVTFATLLGAASSSCSYAAVAVGRGLFRKGATFANAILFEFASTNLVFELGLVLLVLLGWQFLAAELAGGLAMIAILAVVFKYTLRSRLVEEAQRQAEMGLRGRMEGHGDMDMSVRHAIEAFQARPSWNYTTFLNLAALALAAVMGWRFGTTGGMQMLRAMESAPTPGREMVHDHHEHHHHH